MESIHGTGTKEKGALLFPQSAVCLPAAQLPGSSLAFMGHFLTGLWGCCFNEPQIVTDRAAGSKAGPKKMVPKRWSHRVRHGQAKPSQPQGLKGIFVRSSGEEEYEKGRRKCWEEREEGTGRALYSEIRGGQHSGSN